MPLRARPLRIALRVPFGPPLAALALAALFPPIARAQTLAPVTLDASSAIQYRVTLAGHIGPWASGPVNASVDIGAPASPGAGPVVLRNLHLTASSVQCAVPVQGVSLMVSLAQIVINAAPGAGASLPASAGPAGAINFAGSGLSCSATGAANYFATGLTCNTLQAGGAPCSGPFDLAAAGPNTSGAVDLGAVNPGSPRTFSLRFFASFPLAPGATWGKVDVLANLSGTLASGPPPCPADFNTSGTLNVQDIFDFLAGWFAASPAADFNHVSGLTVQDIFDFLAAWFTGC